MKKQKSKIEIVARIKKLMKLARSEKAIGNDDAAARCDEKIAELRAKHDITAEIVLDDEPPVDFDGEPYFTMDSPHFRRRRIFWQEVLGGVTAQFFDCTTVLFRGGNLQVVVGDRANRQAAIECFRLLHGQAIERAAELPKKSLANEARLQSQSFLLGFALGVQQRFSGYKYNEAQLERYRHHLPESRVPVNPQGLVKPERLVVAEKTARQERIELATSDLKKPPAPEINALDDESYVEGIRFGHSCALPEAVQTEAQKVYDRLEEIEREMRRKYEERLRRTESVSFYLDLGTPTVSYSTTTATFRGRQINLDFD